MAREQFLLLLVYPDEAVAAIADLLPESPEERRKAFAAIRQVLSASSEITGEAAARLARIAPLFGVAGNSSEKVVDLLKAS
jgi:DNA-directed RNA polymerase subunit F